MKFIIYALTFLSVLKINAQEDKIGAMKTNNGTLLYFNDESFYTIELNGEVELKNFPLINNNNSDFQIITNTLNIKSDDVKAILYEYYKWELDHINEVLPEKVSPTSSVLSNGEEIISFWYFYNPLIENSNPDITPYKMTCFLDWKKGNTLFRLTHPSFSDNPEKAKELLLSLKNQIRYYNSKINLDLLYENVSNNKNFYIEN